jgi:hypothetical protein
LPECPDGISKGDTFGRLLFHLPSFAERYLTGDTL